MNELQSEILSIYKEINKVCKRNNIDCIAVAGTCLGAVRHQGFIPWDDDLDIGVAIEDYDRLLSLLRKELPPHLKVITPSDVKHMHLFFSKVTNINTTCIEENVKPFPDRYMGVFVDLFPLFGIGGGY